MKVLFLDIDGVVNCKTTMQRHRGAIGIDPYLAFLVGKIQLDTSCQVVLSSSWKNWPEGVEEVKRQVVDILDTTPNFALTDYEDRPRGNEIQRWLDKHPGVTIYAILDDDTDMLHSQQPNFFKTSWDTGITEDIAKRVTDHLNGGSN